MLRPQSTMENNGNAPNQSHAGTSNPEVPGFLPAVQRGERVQLVVVLRHGRSAFAVRQARCRTFLAQDTAPVLFKGLEKMRRRLFSELC